VNKGGSKNTNINKKGIYFVDRQTKEVLLASYIQLSPFGMVLKEEGGSIWYSGIIHLSDEWESWANWKDTSQ